MRRNLIIALCLALLGLHPGLARAQSAAEMAQKGFDLCASRFPETKQTRELLKEQGWRYWGTDGEFHVFSAVKNTAMVATSAAGERMQACMMTFRGLDEDEALALAAKIGKASGLTPVKSPGFQLGEGWLARLNGIKVALFATTTGDFYFMRTSAIVLRKVD